MILRSIAKSIRKQDWSVLFLELVVVVVGLMLAFQLDRWWEGQADRSHERDYINRLITEVQDDVEQISFAMELAEVRQGFGDLLIEAAADPLVAERQPAMFLVAVAQAPFTYTPSLTSHAFEELRSTGGMGLIRSTEIKSALYDYYGFHASQSQFLRLNLNIEMRYFELAAEVLTADQYEWVQDQWFVVNNDNIEEVSQAEPDPEALPGAIDRFLGNQALLAWLPRTRGVQREQILINRALLERADRLLASLQDYSIAISH